MTQMANFRRGLTPFVALLMLAFVVISPQIAFTEHKQRVLIMSSYHPAFPTFFEQINGVRSVFEGESIELDIEFMDSKRFFDETNFDNFYQSLSHKLSQLPPYDAVIVTDDNALVFTLDHQNELFAFTPIIFLGVNNISMALEQNSNPYVTGVVESISMVDTIDLMIQLTPNVSTIYAIVDETPSGQGDLKTFREITRNLNNDVGFAELSLADMTFTQLANELAALPEGCPVLLLSAYRDSVGNALDFEESLRLIRGSVQQPLYHLWYHGMGDGILGGKLISHFEQGKTAAEITLDVLDGTPAQDISVSTRSPNRYIFDFNEMERFNIQVSDLPPDSLVLNRPVTFYSQYKTLVWTTGTAFLVLSALVVLSSVNIVNLRRARKELLLSDEILRQMPEAIILTDMQGVIQRWMGKAERIFGYSAEEACGQPVGFLYESGTKSGVTKRIVDEIQDTGGFLGEVPCVRNDGMRIPVEIASSTVYDKSGTTIGLVSVNQDITERKRAEAEVQKSHFIIKSTSDAVIVTDVEGRITFWNKGAERLYGYSREETSGRPVSILYKDEDLPILESMIADLMSGNDIPSIELTCINKHKRDVEILLSLTTIKDSDGSISELVGITKDITERKQAEEKLKESEERFRVIFEQAGVGVSQVYSKTGDYVRLNQRYADILGYKIEELVALTFQEMTHPDDLQEDLDNMKRLMDGEIREFTMEKRLFHKNRSIVWVNLTVSPMWDVGEEPSHHIAVVEDITGRKRTEEALRENEEKYRALFDNLPIPAYTKNLQGVYTSCNTENRRYWAANPVGKTDADLLDPAAAAPLREFDLRVMEAGEMLIREECLPDTPLGERRFISRKVPLRDVSGDVVGVLGASLDITDRERAEEERLKLKKLESVGVLAGGIAHDFNNLLTGLFGNLEMAKIFLGADHKSHKYLETAMNAMEHATALTNQLLTFAKGGDPIKEVLSIRKVITETTLFSLRGSNVKAQITIGPDLWWIEADRGQLSQVISNLVINAQQAMPAGGTVTVAAENDELAGVRCVKVTIQDEGVGIAPEHLGNVFDPYFTTKQKGSGLGLATTHSIINKHGGTIAVDSRLGRGTTFIIHLPASEKESTKISAANIESLPDARRAARILVLDDEEIIRELLGEMLESMGYEVAFAVEGEEAIAEYQAACDDQNPYDLLFTDLTIPGGVGGVEASQAILKINPDAKIIVSSGYATDPVMANYESYGFRGVAVKPYRIADIEDVVRQVLQSDDKRIE